MPLISIDRLIKYLNVVLFILIIISILFLIRAFNEIPSLKNNTLHDKKRPGPEQRISRIEDYSGLVKENPFGIKDEFRILTAVDSGNERSPEGFILVGTVSGESYGYAIIQDSRGNQNLYRTGENVMGAGILKSVKKDRIILKTSSGERVVMLSDIVVKEIPQRTSSLSREGYPVRPFPSPAPSAQFILDSENIKRAMENPRDILTHARFIPNIVDGRQEGFIIKELKRGGVYESLGLQEGDVLLSVNGLPITGPESALQAFSAIKGMDRVELDILRNGARMTMTYLIR